MSERIKNLLGVAIIVVALAFAYAAVAYVGSYKISTQPSSFTVTGEGKIVAIPDIARFTYSIITEGGKDVATLQTQNTKKGNDIVEYLKAQGVADKDIQTTAYEINPRYQNFNCQQPFNSTDAKPCPPPEIVGYTITQTSQVKVRDFNKAGSFLTAVAKQGANNVSALSFNIDEPKIVQAQARDKAIKDAVIKAQEMSKAGGFRVGKLLSVDEANAPQPYLMYSKGGGAAMDRAASVASPAPAIQPGSQDINISVTLRYEIR